MKKINNQKLYFKILLIILAVVVLLVAGYFGWSFCQTKKQTKALNINQPVNQVQEKDTNETNNIENTNNNQENVVNNNQEELVPEGWEKYSYSKNGFYLSFNYPQNLDWNIEEGDSVIVYRTTSKGDKVSEYVFRFIQEDNNIDPEEWIKNPPDIGIMKEPGADFEKFTTSNGLVGYRGLMINGETNRYYYYFFKGNKVLIVIDFFRQWYYPSDQTVETDEKILNSINFY